MLRLDDLLHRLRQLLQLRLVRHRVDDVRRLEHALTQRPHEKGRRAARQRAASLRPFDPCLRRVERGNPRILLGERFVVEWLPRRARRFILGLVRLKDPQRLRHVRDQNVAQAFLFLRGCQLFSLRARTEDLGAPLGAFATQVFKFLHFLDVFHQLVEAQGRDARVFGVRPLSLLKGLLRHVPELRVALHQLKHLAAQLRDAGHALA